MVFFKTAEARRRCRSRGKVQSSFWGCSGLLLCASSGAGLPWAGLISFAPRPVLVDLMLWVWTEVLSGREGLPTCSPRPPVYGGARAASVAHRMLSKLGGLRPWGASALEGAPIFELTWITLIWGNKLPFISFSPLWSSLSPQSRFCVPCYCCISSLWTLPWLGKPVTSPGSCC